MRLSLGLALTANSVMGGASDTTAPVVTSSSYDGGTTTVSLDIVEASGSATCYWALVANPSTPTEAQVVAGTGGGILEAGSFTVTTGGDTDLIDVTDVTGNEIHIVIKDAAGNSTGTPSGANNTVITGVTVVGAAPSIVETDASVAEAASATSVTISGFTHGAGSNRKVIVLAGSFIGTPAAHTMTATYDGVSMEEVAAVDTTADYERAYMFQLPEASLPVGGSGDIVVTASTTIDDFCAVAFTVKDCEQVVAASMDARTTNESYTGDITPSTANSLVVGFGNNSTASSTATWTAGLTGLTIGGNSSNPYASGGGTATVIVGYKQQDASSLTCTHDMTTGRKQLILASFQPA